MITPITPTHLKRALGAGMLTIAALALTTTSALAQRDPAYQAARQAGQIGEQVDGYLGYVTTPTPAIRALVLDLNIKRKAAYTESAGATGSTVEQFAFTSGCRLISNTQPGEKYQAPDGRWMTRGDGPPTRDPRCP